MPTEPDYLRGFSCFRSLPDDKLAGIAEISNAVCYPPNYVLFKNDTPGDRIFLLVKGEVEVLYDIGEEGQTRVDIVSGEEIAGCSALVDPYVYTATERSLTEVEVLEIDASALRNMMREDCSLGYAIQQQVMRILLDRIMNLRMGC